MKYLLITLGHGSSAIYIDDEKKTVIGYEQERLSGIKADSQFPKDAINEIINNIGYMEMKGCNIFISHWFNHQDSPADILYNKYIQEIDAMNLKALSSNIMQVNKSFSHHDAHAYSALSFLKYNRPSYNKETYTIVADGFGNNEEVLSVYKSEMNDIMSPKLVLRVSDYRASLGLMYQYATSFCGMKENQDEYKFLGYESHIDEILSLEMIDTLDFYIEDNVKILESFVRRETLKKPADRTVCKECNPNVLIDTDALIDVRMHWYDVFKEVLNIVNVDVINDSYRVRCIIAYFIQQSIEIFFVRLINEFSMQNVCLAGGCFYNVKLNNTILHHIAGNLCIMPLAGDQGAAIGMYTAFARKIFNFGNLCFGKRRLYNIEKYERDNIKVVNLKTPGILQSIARDICDGNIINIVRENMEFGPRALCSTSSLFLPTAENVARNNTMNRRNEVMPCAPVILSGNAHTMFYSKDLSRVIGSSKYMICTFDYIKKYSKQYGGVMHKKPLENVYTGRPQIIEPDYIDTENDFMYNLLAAVEDICDAKCLVNTSFNAHGRPIVFDTMDIIHNFNFQCEHSQSGKQPILYIIKD